VWDTVLSGEGQIGELLQNGVSGHIHFQPRSKSGCYFGASEWCLHHRHAEWFFSVDVSVLSSWPTHNMCWPHFLIGRLF
jgi:hypothetical protein